MEIQATENDDGSLTVECRICPIDRPLIERAAKIQRIALPDFCALSAYRFAISTITREGADPHEK